MNPPLNRPDNHNPRGRTAGTTEPAAPAVAALTLSELMTTDELVARFHWFTKNYWARLRCRGPGEGPAYLRVGNRILYREGDVLAWLAGHRVTSTSGAKQQRAAA